LITGDHKSDGAIVRRQGVDPSQLAFKRAAGKGPVDVDEGTNPLPEQGLQLRKRLAELDFERLVHTM
jgi:hypothetical protein